MSGPGPARVWQRTGHAASGGSLEYLTVAQAATLVVRTLAFIHAAQPSAPAVEDQGGTGANYNYAVAATLLKLVATKDSGLETRDFSTTPPQPSTANPCDI